MEINNDAMQNNSSIIKGDIFSEYLNCDNKNYSQNQDFIKPNNETFDKFFFSEDNSIKSINSINQIDKSIKTIIPDSSKKKDINIKNNSKKATKEINYEELREKRLLKIREYVSASRLKKKKYIQSLERQYEELKKEYLEIMEKKKTNNGNEINNNENQIITLNNTQKEQNKKNKEKLDPNNQEEREFKEIQNLENDILYKGLENDNITITNYKNKQKQINLHLLINQIDLMTPIKIKVYQNKYFKMEQLEYDDSFEVIKNKIQFNINSISEFCGISNTEDLKSFKGKKSLAIQIYQYYIDIKLLINKFEKIFEQFNI